LKAVARSSSGKARCCAAAGWLAAALSGVAGDGAGVSGALAGTREQERSATAAKQAAVILANM
jgi:hypothetical protein